MEKVRSGGADGSVGVRTRQLPIERHALTVEVVAVVLLLLLLLLLVARVSLEGKSAADRVESDVGGGGGGGVVDLRLRRRVARQSHRNDDKSPKQWEKLNDEILKREISLMRFGEENRKSRHWWCYCYYFFSFHILVCAFALFHFVNLVDVVGY